MSIDHSISEEQTPTVSPGNYSPVTITIKDTVGTIFLGIFAALFLVGWMRAEARYRDLLTKHKMEQGSN